MSQSDMSPGERKARALADLASIAAKQRERGMREDDHIDADAILVDLIGDQDVAAAYEAIGKWYA